MPEGDAIKKEEQRWKALVGKEIAWQSPQGRASAIAEVLNAKRLTATDAHGKHLFLQFEDQYLHIHLGLYGHFRWSKDGSAVKESTRLYAQSANIHVTLTAPTRCQLITEEEKQAIHQRLGLDAYRDESIDALLPFLRQCKQPVGRVLMEQNRIAGIGNVYRAELLFFLQINPWTKASEVSEDTWRKLWTLNRVFMEESLSRMARIQTTAPALPLPQTVAERPKRARCYAYKRTDEQCFGCCDLIKQELFFSRTLYWCPTCQA